MVGSGIKHPGSATLCQSKLNPTCWKWVETIFLIHFQIWIQLKFRIWIYGRYHASNVFLFWQVGSSGGGGGGVGGGGGGGGGGASSPDSSSDSSAGSPQHSLYDGPNVEAERCLPGVIMASQVTLSNLCSYFDFKRFIPACSS
jgi:hypothetical protein